MTMKTTTGKEEVCDETCDCHSEDPRNGLTEVGDDVWTDENGGEGPSERMLELLEKKRIRNLKTKGGIKS